MAVGNRQRSAVKKSRESEFPPTRNQKESGIGVPSYKKSKRVGNRSSLLQEIKKSRESEFPPTKNQKESGIGVPSYKKGK